MSELEHVWVPLVDEPIGSIVDRIQAEDPDITRLAIGPRRALAFRTFAYIRVGMLLGELLVEHDLPPYDDSGTWVDQLLARPEHREAIAAEVRAVAAEIAADPAFGDEDELGPDDAARERFRAFARQQLESH